MMYILLAVMVFVYSACTPDEKVLDTRVRVQLVAVNADSTALIYVHFENLVKYYSSYLQGYDEEWKSVESKFVLVNMYKEQILREYDNLYKEQILRKYGEIPLGIWFQLDESNIMFYDFVFPPFKVTKVLKWDFEKDVVEDLRVSDKIIEFNSLNDTAQINVFYTMTSGGISGERRFYFYIDDSKKIFQEVEMSYIQQKTDCLDFYYVDTSIVCLTVDSDVVKLLDEKQNVLDSIYSKQISMVRFRGPKLQINDRVYPLLGKGKIDRSDWLEIQIGRQGESFPIIFSNENGSVSYGENNF